jgi:hypothetical protein
MPDVTCMIPYPKSKLNSGRPDGVNWRHPLSTQPTAFSTDGGIVWTPVADGICGYEDGSSPLAARSNATAMAQVLGWLQAEADEAGRTGVTTAAAIRHRSDAVSRRSPYRVAEYVA